MTVRLRRLRLQRKFGEERLDLSVGDGGLIFLALAAAMAVFSLRSFITAPITP